MSAPPAPLDLSQRLALILEALRATLAALAGRNRSLSPVVLLAWPYLHRVAARFASLVRRVQAGGRAVLTPRTRPASLVPRLRPPRLLPGLPRGFGWMGRLGSEPRALASQIWHLLKDPEFAALLAEAPQAGRILRPLCRMLGIEPAPELPAALFKPPARPRSPAQPLPAPPLPTQPLPTQPSPTPPLPVLETSPPPSPAPDWPSPPATSPRHRAQLRGPPFRARPA